MTDHLLTLGDVADYLRCSVRTVKRRVRDGELPVVADGAIVRVRETDLARYVAKRTVSRAPELELGGPREAGVVLEPGARLWNSAA